MKKFQKINQPEMKNLDINKEKDKTRYLSQKHEIHSYLTQINNQLKHIKQTHHDIDFNKALHKTDFWDKFEKYVFKHNPKIKNKMLSKLVNYWNKL
jgi:hypothetical protein